MNEIINLMMWAIENGISVSIEHEPDIGGSYLNLKLGKGDKKIDYCFYYVPAGDKSVQAFKNYNPTYEVEVEEILNKIKKNYILE